jgi:arylsulfatase A-like enzyme
LYCLADDWGWPNAGAYGDHVVRTPVFDRLAHDGVLFTHAFCAAPSCTASRAAMLTGQYPHRLEQGGNLWGFLPKKYPVYPDLLETAGYHVGITRKGWGPGSFQAGGYERNPAGPSYKSFEEFLKSVPSGKPFCFWFGSLDPHRPYEPGSGAASGLKADAVKVPPYLPDAPEVRNDILDYYAEVERFDREVGEILDLLQRTGKLDNTLVVVSGDNGWPFPRCKANLYDGGTHQPMAVSWPARIKGGRVLDDFVNLMDLAPTFLEAAGLKPPAEMTGRSVLPLLDGREKPGSRNAVFLERERHANVRKGDLSYPMRAVRTRDYLYIRNLRPDRWPAGDPEMYRDVGPFGDCDGGPTKQYMLDHRDDPAVKSLFGLAFDRRPAEELYDLAKDPYQMQNLAGQAKHAAAQRKLRAELDRWMAQTGDPRATSDADPWDHYPYFGGKAKPKAKPAAKPKAKATAAPRKPNVIVVLTDDQGYGDFGCHGNPVLKTPNLDRLHDQSIRLTDFHVAPMCTPTRSQIITGRDCLANGAYVVCSGHGFIQRGIPTLADLFAAGGYRTGMFGKWHLGDNYPYRPQDRGFQESLTFRGWGLTSSQDFWCNDYFNDTYWHNGRLQKYAGYCTDVWFREALAWIKAQAAAGQPFFVYLPTNAPHGPLWVPQKYVDPYLGKVGPAVARFFGMIANIDENMDRLDRMLRESGLYDNTILVFMTDNGGTVGVKTWNAGMRGGKTQYYDGGHRVPCFVRWPAGKLRPAGDVPELAQCQDLLPTLAELCGLPIPVGTTFDGTSLAPLLRGQDQPELGARKLVVQYGIWEEYQGPTKWNCAVMWGKWRLVQGRELYDIQADPGQKTDVAPQHAQVVAALRAHYEQWWAKTEPLAREFHPIHIGSEHEDPTVIGCQDWVAPNTSNAPWIREGVNRNGLWHVLVEREGQYEFALQRWPTEARAALDADVPACQGELGQFKAGVALPIAKARLQVAGVDQSRPVAANDRAAVFRVRLPAGKTTLQTWFYDAAGKELCGAYYVYVRRVPQAAGILERR